MALWLLESCLHLGFQLGFYTRDFGAGMGALIMDTCVSALRYKEIVDHGCFGGLLTVLYTIKLRIGLI